MINAWSLAWEALNGTMDEEYPIIDTNVGAGNTAFESDGLDYEVDLFDGASADYMSDIDDMYSHQFTTWDDGMSLHVTEEQNMKDDMTNNSDEFISKLSDNICLKIPGFMKKRNIENQT